MTIILLMQLLPITVFAISKSSIVNPAQLKLAEVIVAYKGKVIKRTVYCLNSIPGSIKTIKGKVYFSSLAQKINKLKKQRASQALISQENAFKKKAQTTCTNLYNNSPTPTATPPPTATPASKFDSQGNLTQSGKEYFLVPSNLNGNISAGRTICLSYCSCHGEKLGKTFVDLRMLIMGYPMYIDSQLVDDQMLADLTAYLNRFNN